MPRRRRDEWRALGPYKHGNRYRVLVVAPGGGQRDRRTKRKTFDTAELAEAFIRKFYERVGRGTITIRAALEGYERHLETAGLQSVTVETMLRRTRGFFAKEMGRPLGELTPAQARRMYKDLRSRPRRAEWENPLATEAKKERPTIAVQTHHGMLFEAKRFLRWCVSEGTLRASPLEEVEPVGVPNRGKEQLTIDEGRELLATCLRELEDGDEAALAVIIAAIFGIRAAAIASLTVRDIDDRGRVLVVRKSKTEASRNLRLRVPVELQPVLAGYVEGRIGRLFPDRNRHWVLYHVKRLCRLAGVPEITVHGLRGTQGSTATEEGATAEQVMKAYGHTSTAVGRRHYIRPGASESARAQRAAAALLPQEEVDESEG